jgi:predicted ATP-dependent endonuclease of OLD family
VQLEKVRVTNFRSVDDSEEFSIGRVTCLVGKNEAGKSAILLALAALNPHPATPAVFDKERDYPRGQLTKYDERHKENAALAISTKWRLSPAEMGQIASELGPDALASDEITVERRYGKDLDIKVSINCAAVIKNLFERFGLDEMERSTLTSATTTTTLIDVLNELPAPTERQLRLKEFLGKCGNVSGQVSKIILTILPKFMYFSSYDRMDGAIQIEETRQLIGDGHINLDPHKGKRLFADFLDYAGVPIADITNVATYETFNARLQAASNNITDQVLEYWTQNPDLSVAVRVEQARPGDLHPLNSGTIAWARINNQLHRVDTPFSERSAGFVWFFSFLVKFAQVKVEQAPVVLLLDEPGLTLHGKAQADLLRFFKEKLAPHHQIIYSTHSPFMVPADELASVRIVQDQVEMKGHRRIPHGTKVRSDVLTRDPDTLFPLQAALGYEITQSLFVGKHTLLVEGPGDILYIQGLTDALRRRGRPGLDSRWTLCPAGGIDKIRPFVALFAGNALHIAVLSDQAYGDKRKVEEMKRAAVLKAGHFYTIADLIDRAEADIEDIFEPELFAAILNEAYSLKDPHKLNAEKLRNAGNGSERLVKQAEAAFAIMPADVQEFDHFTPAAWLIRGSKLLDGKTSQVSTTLDRAQQIFDTYNKIL